MTKGPKFTLQAADFCSPLENVGANWEMAGLPFYSSYSSNRWYNIGGDVLGVGRWNEGYIRNFSLLPF